MPKKKKENIFEKAKKQGIVSEPEQFRDEKEEHSENPEELQAKMSSGSAETDVYSGEGREEMMEEDELAGWEEGFSEGETNNELAHCAQCGEVIGQNASRIVESESDHTKYVFCSALCAKKGVRHAKKK
jgi:hypothetical protein